jgi:hypothetical protein
LIGWRRVPSAQSRCDIAYLFGSLVVNGAARQYAWFVITADRAIEMVESTGRPAAAMARARVRLQR